MDVAMALASEIERLEEFGFDDCHLFVGQLERGRVVVSYHRGSAGCPLIEFSFDACEVDDARRRLGVWAADRGLEFGWYEAKCLVVVVNAVEQCWQRTARASKRGAA